MKQSVLRSEEYRSSPLIVRNFIRAKIAIEGCSEKTAEEYLSDLRTFFRYTEAVRLSIPFDNEAFRQSDLAVIDLTYVLGIDRECILDFLSYAATERGNERASRARKLSTLKSFFRFVAESDSRYRDFDPTKGIKSPKKEQLLPKYLTEEESISLLKAVLADEDSRWVKRDFAMITLFLNCGMRLSELVGISLSDLDKNLLSLRVYGKGAKERIVYLNEACQTALFDYLLFRRSLPLATPDESALFLSNRGTRISHKTVQHIVYKYLDAAGLSLRGLSVHKLRHTAATLMYQSGQVDVRVLKDILGHAQLNTTQIYTHLSDRNMQNAMQSNPLARLNAEALSTEEEGEDEDEE